MRIKKNTTNITSHAQPGASEQNIDVVFRAPHGDRIEASHLLTKRLLLRRFSFSDKKDLERIMSNKNLAYKTDNIPYPLPSNFVYSWLQSRITSCLKGQACIYAITKIMDGSLIGGLGLTAPEDHSAVLGYWLDEGAWGYGYCTEAAYALLTHAFNNLQINKIYAQTDADNQASASVLKKLGMKEQGTLKVKRFRYGEYVDRNLYTVTEEEFFNNH